MGEKGKKCEEHFSCKYLMKTFLLSALLFNIRLRVLGWACARRRHVGERGGCDESGLMGLGNSVCLALEHEPLDMGTFE
jgi:hypothetical protein